MAKKESRSGALASHIRAARELSAIGPFSLGENEIKAAQEFLRGHKCPLVPSIRSISYKFTLTGIGVGVDIECSCGTGKNITDYGSW